MNAKSQDRKLELLDSNIMPKAMHERYPTKRVFSHDKKRFQRRCEDEAGRLEHEQGLTHVGAILDVEHCARDYTLAVAFGKHRI